MSVGRPVATVGTLTLASRILGLARDVAFAATLGAGPVAEAFFVAFRLPNLFRRLFAEGAFAVAFVPIFSRRLTAEGEEPAGRFAEETLSALVCLLLAVTLLAQLAMPWLMLAIAGGFAGRDGALDLAVAFSRITFPYLLLLSVFALFAGILNATRRFAAAAAAPILLNVTFLAALGLAVWFEWSPGYAASWAVPVAGVLQLAVVVRAARRAGFRLRLRRPRLTPGVRRLLRVAAPAALGSGVHQINLLIGTLIASFFPGAVAWLQYADRLYQLPLGVVGVALGVVLLPELARRLGAGDEAGARDSFSRSVEIAVAVGAPAMVALMVVPGPVVSVLFERGAFGAGDRLETARAVVLFAAGLPAFMLSKVYATAFFAREDTRTPVRYASASFAVNSALAAGGAAAWGYLAIPAATTIAAWLMLALFVRGSRRTAEARLDAGVRRRAPRAVLASLAMGAAVVGAAFGLEDALSAPFLRYGALAALVAVGVSVYVAVGAGVGAFDMAGIRRALRIRAPRRPDAAT